MPKEGDLQVWWIPQVPMKAFLYSVGSVDEAVMILEVLALYDLFQFENNVKGDYANVGGLNIFEEGEWVNWWSDEYGDIEEYIRETQKE